MTKIVDNFDLLADNLFAEPLAEGEFYFVQILIRGKDGHNVNGNNKNRLVRYYVVRGKEKLLELKPEIVMLCKLHNARAYIHTTPREDKDVASEMLKEAVTEFTVGNYHVFRRLFSTACGKSFSTKKKTFLVDLDPEQLENENLKTFSAAFNYTPLEMIENFVNSCRGVGGENAKKVIVKIPTKSGIHLICKPFDVGQFNMKFNGHDIQPPDVHKNNPTLLYFETGEIE